MILDQDLKFYRLIQSTGIGQFSVWGVQWLGSEALGSTWIGQFRDWAVKQRAVEYWAIKFWAVEFWAVENWAVNTQPHSFISSLLVFRQYMKLTLVRTETPSSYVLVGPFYVFAV